MIKFDRQSFAQAVTDGIRKQRKAPDIAVGPDQSFSTFGLDSLDVMNLVLEVESALGINLGEFDIGEDDTTETFIAKANARLASA
jgi:acyl carrier protein